MAMKVFVTCINGLTSISAGDIVFFQHPTWHQLKFEEGIINRIKAYGEG